MTPQEPPIARAARELPERAYTALSEFFRLEAAGGILLICAAALALVCANSPLQDFYEAFHDMQVVVQVGDVKIDKPLLLWINDGLMAIFFLLVALEIKREAMGGRLSSRSQVTLPLVCAFAGVAVPAAIYWGINRGTEGMGGWAIPAATDIAFALGILSLLGSRVPTSMKLLLSTIAVVDDLAAIVIIAVFYTAGLSVTALSWAMAAIAAMLVLNRKGVTALAPYLLLGLVVWVAVLKSGVHATLAGVITGLMIPHGPPVKDGKRKAPTPLDTLEHALHPWVAYAILPMFAFANAGLALGDFSLEDLGHPVTLGVMLGLLLGKPIGIVAAALIARALGIVRLPEGMTVGALVGLGLLCGIGFTMSIFIATLAFAGNGDLASISLLGVLLASVAAAVAGYLWLRWTLPRKATGGD